MQGKQVTATSGQTWNPTGPGASDWILGCLIFTDTPVPAITQAAYGFYNDGTESGSTALALQDTAPTIDITSGDVDVQLRMRLQASALAVTTIGFQLQWEKNNSGTWQDVAESGKDLATYIARGQSSATITWTTGLGIGESFKGNGQKLTGASFRVGATVGAPFTLRAELYAHTGTFGTGSSTATGSALAVSNSRPAADAQDNSTYPYRFLDFDFDGSYTLVNGTAYVIMVVQSAASASPYSASFNLSGDTAEYEGAGQAKSATGVFSNYVSGDVHFKVFTNNPAVTGYDVESFDSTFVAPVTNLTSVSNRLGTGSGSFVAGQVAQDGLIAYHSVTANNYTELLYSIRLKNARLTQGDTLKFRVVQKQAPANLTYSSTPTINITKTVPMVSLDAYQFFGEGTEAGSTALAALNTVPTVEVGEDSVLQLRARLQVLELPFAGTEDWQLQYERNGSGTWNTVSYYASHAPVTSGSSATLVGEPGQTVGRRGQSFMGNGQKLLTAENVSNKQSGTLGDTTARIYAHSGTFGALNSVPTGAALATSAVVPGNSLPTVNNWVTYTFDGTFTLQNGVPYFVVWHIAGATSSDYAYILGSQNGIHPGIYTEWWGSYYSNTWEKMDVYHRITTYMPYLVPYDSASLTDGAATSNRLGAGSGTFVAGKVSEDGLVDDVGIASNSYTELLYSILLKSVDLNDGDVLRFRIVRTGTTEAFVGYPQYPTINVAKSVLNITQPTYRFYEDGPESSSNPLAAENGSALVSIGLGDAPVQVRTLLQSTTGANLPATSDLQLQYQALRGGQPITKAPADSLWYAYEPSGNNSGGLFGPTSWNIAVQSIVGDGSYLSSVEFPFKLVGSPTGTMTAYLFPAALPTPNPTASALAASTAMPLTGINTSTWTWVKFTFDGTFQLQSGVTYNIGVQAPTGAGASAGVYYQVLGFTEPGRQSHYYVPSTTWQTSTGQVGSEEDLAMRIRTFATWASVGASLDPAPTLVDDHSPGTLGALAFGNGTLTGVGQSFKGNGQALKRVSLYLGFTGNRPTAGLALSVTGITGTYGTTSISDRIPISVSTGKAATDIPAGGGWVDFEFENIATALTAGSSYALALTTAQSDVNSYYNVYQSTTSETTGNEMTRTGTTWTAVSARDLYFRTYCVPAAQPTSSWYTGGQAAAYGNIGTQPSMSIVGNGQAIKAAGFKHASITFTGSATIRMTVHQPLGTVVHASASMDARSIVDMAYNYCLFTFDGTFVLQEGQTYYISLDTTNIPDVWTMYMEYDVGLGSPNVSYYWHRTNGYWVTNNVDFDFMLYTGPAPVIVPYNSPSLTDGQATTKRLTGGTGSFSPGKVSEDGLVDDLRIPGNNNTELLYSLQVLAAAGADGDTFQFRTLLDGATALTGPNPTLALTTATGPQNKATFNHLWTAGATGEKPYIPPKLGSATASHTWTVAPASGWQPKRGQATASHTWTTAPATGKRVMRTAQVTASHLWTLTATGQRAMRGTATATHLWSATPATGKKTMRGSTTASHMWSIALTSKKIMKGQATAAHTWNNTAAGVKPLVPVKRGDATAAWLVSSGYVIDDGFDGALDTQLTAIGYVPMYSGSLYLDGNGNAVTKGGWGAVISPTAVVNNSWMEIAFRLDDVSSLDISMVFRLPSAASSNGIDSGYVVRANDYGLGIDRLGVSKSSTPRTWVNTKDYVLRAEWVGGNIKVSLDGTEILNWTDPTPLVGNYIGLYLDNNYAGTSDKLRYLRAGTAPVGKTPTGAPGAGTAVASWGVLPVTTNIIYDEFDGAANTKLTTRGWELLPDLSWPTPSYILDGAGSARYDPAEGYGGNMHGTPVPNRVGEFYEFKAKLSTAQYNKRIWLIFRISGQPSDNWQNEGYWIEIGESAGPSYGPGLWIKHGSTHTEANYPFVYGQEYTFRAEFTSANTIVVKVEGVVVLTFVDPNPPLTGTKVALYNDSNSPADIFRYFKAGSVSPAIVAVGKTVSKGSASASWSMAIGGAPTLPVTAGLAVRLEAEDLALANNAAVTAWSNPGDAVDPVIYGAPSPVFKTNATPAGKPVVHFATNEATLRFPGTTGVGLDYTLVYISRQQTTGRVVSSVYPDYSNILFGYHNGSMDVAYDVGFFEPAVGRPLDTTAWNMYSADCATGSVPRFFIDGTYKNSGATQGQGWMGSFALNGYGGLSGEETCVCDVAGVLLYDHKLADVERKQVEDYLRLKYMTGGGGGGAGPIGKQTPKGSAVASWTTSPAGAVGKRLMKATAVASWTATVAPASGKKLQKGAATAAHLWKVTPSTGVTPILGAKQGTATATHTWTTTPATGKRYTRSSSITSAHDWSITVTSRKIMKGQATSGHLWTAEPVTGKRYTKTLSVTASHVWAIAPSTGKRLMKGQATSDHLWTVAPATGKPIRKGQTTSTHLWTVAPTTGKRITYGQTTANHLWKVQPATGVMPILGVKQGTATATHAWTTTPATGKKYPKAQVIFAHSWVATAIGQKYMRGAASPASHTWTTAPATGKRYMKSTLVAASHLWNTTVTGKRYTLGQTTSLHTWNTFPATGITPIVGVKQGTALARHDWTSPATGKKVMKARADATHTWGTFAFGTKAQRGSSIAAHLWTSAPSFGKRFMRTAQVTAAHLWTITSLTGVRRLRGQATVDHLWTPQVAGAPPVLDVKRGTAIILNRWIVDPPTGQRTMRGQATAASHAWTTSASGKKVMKGSTAAVTHLWWVDPSTGRRHTVGLATAVHVWRPSTEGYRFTSGSAVIVFQFKVIGVTGSAGVVGAVYGWWNGRPIVEMQYGDDPIFEWLMVEA
jgi:hypothetical protein